MPQVTVNGVSLEYVSEGDPSNTTILLVMGLGTQLTGWPDAFCQHLVDLGYHVLRFDNRDIGLSTRLTDHGTPNIPALVLRKTLRLPVRVGYELTDMAEDAVALLDALDIPAAHVVGASMGGMIAQLMAANHPERVLSLTSIMSTTGHRSLPHGEREAMKALTLRPDDPDCMDSVLERNTRVRKALQSRSYPKDDDEIRATAKAALDRGGYHPDGVARQLAAIIAAPHRRRLLEQVQQPSLVIHGDEDPLVRVECGIDTAECLPRAELLVLPGMAHDFPTHLLERIARAIHDTAQRATTA